MKCIGKYSKLIAVLSLTAMVTTGCGFGSKNVVADYEIENYNTNLYTGDLFASDLCVASGDVNLKGITSAETDTLHSAALFDVDGKKVDFSYQMFDKIYPASTTKLMTALVALENADLSDVVTVSQNADMNALLQTKQLAEYRLAIRLHYPIYYMVCYFIPEMTMQQQLQNMWAEVWMDLPK